MSNDFPAREYLLDLLVSRLSDYVIVLLDPEGNFRSWNPGVQKTLGYTEEEFIGQNGEILFPLADRLTGAFRRELQRAAEQDRTADTNWMVTKQGRPVLVEGICLALRDPNTNELLGFGKVFHDITKRKQTEDDRRTLLHAIDQAVIYILDWDGIVEHWTSGCERLYGWSAQEMVGKPADELLQTVYLEPLDAVRAKLLKEGVWQGELEQKRKDGSTVYVAGYWALFEDGGNKPAIIIATHTDITQRLEMQREWE